MDISTFWDIIETARARSGPGEPFDQALAGYLALSVVLWWHVWSSHPSSVTMCASVTSWWTSSSTWRWRSPSSRSGCATPRS